MGRSIEKQVSRKVITAPPGTIITVNPEQMQLIRYHARGCRAIKSRSDLKTGRRFVLLGDFFNGRTSAK